MAKHLTEELDTKIESGVKVNPLKDFLAGGFGGVCLVAAGHPLDTIKVRIQTMPTISGAGPQYSSSWDCFATTVRHEGVRGLYKGMAAPIVGVTPMFALCFLGYGVGKKLHQTHPHEELTLFQTFKAGMVSAFFTTPVMTPGERIKCLLQVQSHGGVKKYDGPIHCVKMLYNTGGIASVYRGTFATLLRDIPASGAYFFSYELLQRHLPGKGRKRTDPIGAIRTVAAGGTAGICNWCCCIVQDVLKSKYQTAPDGTYPRGIRDVFKEVMRTDGPKALFRGIGPALARAFPANAACFLGYECAMAFLNWLF